MRYQQPCRSFNLQASLGQLKLDRIIWISLTIVLFTPLYSYHMAVSKKQEPPFPHATVTNTACHYPQDIIFRWNMTWAGSFLVLVYHILFRWIEKKAKQIKYPDSTYSYMYYPTIISILGYLVALGTIDGKGTGTAHTVGAVYFFVMLELLVLNMTIICHKMRKWDSSFMSRGSLLAKKIVNGYLSAIWIYCLIGTVLQLLGVRPMNDDDQYLVIVEWNLVYGGLVWILCFLGDWKHVRLSLNKPQ